MDGRGRFRRVLDRFWRGLAWSCLLLAPLPAAARDAALAGAGWGAARSDVTPDPAWRFERLPNGMRFVVRRNTRPAGAVLVRMEVAAGSLDERDDERGYAHFVEHMAFQGSTRVPPGEMVRLLERHGLAFGADTNAATGFERTTYMLDLPRADPALLDAALMLMRETASELRFDPAQLARERGVVLAEMRDRDSYAYREMADRLQAMAPAARYPRRLPIGTAATLDAATADGLRAFWARTYVPARTTVIVVGDIDEAAARTLVQRHFADWRPAASPAQPSPGPLATGKSPPSLYIDPALPERVTVAARGKWRGGPDTLRRRREDLRARIGTAIVNRRLARIARQPDPPFRSAGFATAPVFHIGRSTSLSVESLDGQWPRALASATAEYRRALAHGFTAGEVAEQLADLRTALRHAAAAADTRTSGELVAEAFDFLHEGAVPDAPAASLAWFEAEAHAITPATVLAAWRRDVVPLEKSPLIRFQGRKPADPAGLLAAWNAAIARPPAPAPAEAIGGFAYTDFGRPGKVVADTRATPLAIRQVRFANGVRLNLRRTDLEQDRVLVDMQVDGGSLLATRDNPLAVAMVPSLIAGGLGKHSLDDLQSLLAGHAVSTGLAVGAETFVASAATTPADLALQLELMAATLTDPGYRPEGEAQFRAGIANWYAQLRATPASALAAAIGGILSDGDPRFTTQPEAAYAGLGYARLREAIADRLQHGAIELGIVGAIDEEATIALVARTLGALPQRERDFRGYDDRRARPFTRDRAPRTVTHTGQPGQALLRLTWQTRDDADPLEKQALNLLERVVRIELTEALRQQLGKAYSPAASSEPSRTWRGYGTFAVAASVDLADVPAVRSAIADTVAALRDRPVADDLLLRARAPLAELFDNQLKTNAGWLALVTRAQTQPDRIDRQLQASRRLMTLTAADVQAVARRYLTDDRLVEIVVVPEPVTVAATIAPAGPDISVR